MRWISSSALSCSGSRSFSPFWWHWVSRNGTFWILILTADILAPRFLIKFFKSTYMPLDKDIVREMWVGGDLKDRLGIRHRKESKNKRVSDLETAPMFREPHARSASELALQQGYEPTVTRS